MPGYAICTVGRSGSTWLAELLGGTNVLGRPSEYFSTAFQQRLNGPSYPVDRAAQVAHVREAGTTPNGIYAFKIFPVHFAAVSHELSWRAAFPDLRFIHWRRRDVLGQAISRVRAEQTQQWRSTLPRLREPTYDGAAIRDAMHWLVAQDARWDLFFARNGLIPLRLVYEAALLAPQATVDAVADLVGLASRPTIDFSRIEIAVQRDASSADWRRMFLDEYADLDWIEDL